MPTNDKSLKSVTQAFHILEYIRENEPVRLTTISTDLSIAKSTMHRYLSTLIENKYLVCQDGQYLISSAFLEYANTIQTRDPFYPLVNAKIQQLANETGELVQFIIEEYGRAIYLFQAIGDNGVQVGNYGKTSGPLHSTAGGKAIMSTWNDDRVVDLCEQTGLSKKTEQTITSVSDLLTELAETRSRGYAINNQENVVGLNAISVPVCNESGTAIGAVSISGPRNRLTEKKCDTELKDILLSVSNELELNYRLL